MNLHKCTHLHEILFQCQLAPGHTGKHRDGGAEWEDELSIRLTPQCKPQGKGSWGFAQRFLLATFGDDDWITRFMAWWMLLLLVAAFINSAFKIFSLMR